MTRMTRSLPFLVALPVAGLLCAWLALPAAPAAAVVAAGVAAAPVAADGYEIDGIHSSMVFRIQHMGVSYFYGRFNDVSGQFSFDEKDPSKCSVEVVIKAESVDTNSAKRDDHVRSPDFLNASEFPEMSFKSESVKAGKDGALEVTGPFTAHGVTKTISVTVEKVGLAEGQRGKLAGFETVFSFKRSDYGMDQMLDALGDEVRIHLGVEGRAK